MIKTSLEVPKQDLRINLDLNLDITATQYYFPLWRYPKVYFGFRKPKQTARQTDDFWHKHYKYVSHDI